MNNFTKLPKQTRAYKFPTGQDLIVNNITAILVEKDGTHVLLDDTSALTVVTNDFQAYKMLFDEPPVFTDEESQAPNIEQEPVEVEEPEAMVKTLKKEKTKKSK